MENCVVAHFVKVTADNYLSESIVVANSDIDDLPYPASEPVGQAYIADVLLLDGEWLQTSYNNNFRVRYASVGMVYNPTLDAFEYAPIPPQE
jgi:hypothetical protein